MEDETLAQFMAVTSVTDSNVAKHYLEMGAGNLDMAISLFFEHGTSSAAQDLPSNSHVGGISEGNVEDAELAERLQREQYQEDTVRPPDQARIETLADTHVFPTIYGGIGGAYGPLRRSADIFDSSRPTGVFNQIPDEDLSVISEDSDIEFDEDEDEEPPSRYEYVEEKVIEIDDDGNVTESIQTVPKLKLESKEDRLTRLFRPPFDIMSRVDLDTARNKGKRKQKWILLNIQDVGVFACQALNRDLWSVKALKKLIKKNFIFLQYQFDSRNAEPYLNFYHLNSKDDLPHIAILDPMTGERLKQWNNTVPKVEVFVQELEEFLGRYSLDLKATNPVIKESTPDPDPTTLTEEQQMELAIKKSLGAKNEDNLGESGQDNEENLRSQPQNQDQLEGDKQEDVFDKIKPLKHHEPPNKPGITTRIQIRIGDGRRLVRRFNAIDDTVKTIYEVVKSDVEGFSDCRFMLSSHDREDLLDKLNLTLEDAGLKNSSLLLEKIDDA